MTKRYTTRKNGTRMTTFRIEMHVPEEFIAWVKRTCGCSQAKAEQHVRKLLTQVAWQGKENRCPEVINHREGAPPWLTWEEVEDLTMTEEQELAGEMVTQYGDHIWLGPW